jgi:hypothetical protein
MGLSKLVAGVTGITMLTIGLAVVAAPTASADEKPSNGGAGVLTPAQPYADKDPKQTQDWLGQYLVKGKAVYCVKWEFNAPGPDTEYTPDGQLADKWGTTLDPQARAEVSYLLLRYGDTDDDNQAAAVAHLLHTYTATGSTDPAKGFKDVGYDAAAHLQELPSAAQDDVARIQADVKANYGPWKVTVTAPTAAQVIGTADKWTIAVNRDGGDGKAITGVPVKLKVTDGTVKKKTVTTPADGSPLTVDVTPTGPNPSVEADVTAPTPEPLVQQPKDASANLQWTVTTGGQTPISDTGKTTATTPPGSVKVTKVDSKTNAGLAGVQLRLTGSDKTAAAVKQDGSPLNGADGKPLVVTTGADGTATVDGLRTPQDICLVEVAAPSGYDENFDASSPPTVCGSVEPGKTLTLQLANTPNTPTVPVKIPAGGSPPVLTAGTETMLNPGALAAVGGLVLAALAGVGLILRRRRLASRG